MKRLLATALRLALIVGLWLPVSASRSQAATGDMWVSGFYVGWMAQSYPPAAIDFSSLTHVMVFSVLPRADGTLDTNLFIDAVNGPRMAQEVAQRAHAAGRKAVLVVGGSGTASAFQGATSAQNMSTFVRNLTQTVADWGFDGVDLDWEPLGASDSSAVLSLIASLRAATPGILVAADVPWLNANFPPGTADALFYSRLADAVDQMNIMTYGMADNWGGWAVWHSSAVRGEGPDHPSSVASSVRLYVNAGVPAAKLGMGIGFYGSCWNAPVTAPLQAPGTSRVVASDNTMGFANIKNLYFSEASYRYDATADAPYLSFSIPSGPAGCTFVSYEDETSVAAKAEYARSVGLGGTIIWQLNEGYNPAAADSSSLLHAVGRAFLGGPLPPPPPPASAPTTTTLTSSRNPSKTSQQVTFTAKVAAVSPGTGTPAGAVQFFDGATLLARVALNQGSASLRKSGLSKGSHSITAVYGGSSSYAPSTSAVLTQTVR